ncbi:hypothetical protein K456DRAFT_43947 [Colletotrichum gloeosporioides 23]|nr:hypothetical protein K456DRAFT_43947 [Colletotrichum gloeosporioides 23]
MSSPSSSDSDSAGVVEVIWKCDKPVRPDMAELALKAHWLNALHGHDGKADEVKTVVIRSGLHNTKMTRTGPVPDDWHVTTSWPDTDRTFSTAHGYTKGRDNYDVVDSTVTTNIPFDKKRGDKKLWPSSSDCLTESLSVDYLNSVLVKDFSHLKLEQRASRRTKRSKAPRNWRQQAMIEGCGGLLQFDSSNNLSAR